MIELTNEIHINQPLANVWAYVGDPTRWHQWRDAMDTPATRQGAGPVEVGAVYVYQTSLLGWEMEPQFELIAYEPQRLITMKRPFPSRRKLPFGARRTVVRRALSRKRKVKSAVFSALPNP